MLQSVAHDTHSLTPANANTLVHIHSTFWLKKKKCDFLNHKYINTLFILTKNLTDVFKEFSLKLKD